jgi:hypothetical protein
MTTTHRGLAACALVLCCLANARAATMCVLNKQTGRLEPLAAGPGGARDCAPTPSAPSSAAPLQQPASPEAAPATAAKVAGASRVEESPEELALPGKPVKPLPETAAMSGEKAKRNWILKTDYHTLEEAIEDFAARVDYEVIYEAREFPLDLKRDLTIARDADFWEALRVLGETYRKSDGAFQILPTKFKQIVVVPMGQETTGGQQ